MKRIRHRQKTTKNNTRFQSTIHFKSAATLVAGLTLISSLSFAAPLANGWDIHRAGLTGTGFTSASGSTWTSGTDANNLGQLAGRTQIYTTDGSSSNGYATWRYDGTNTTKIGFYDSEHTFSTGYTKNYIWDIMENGFVVGGAEQYRGGTDTRTAGFTSWVYNGSATYKIGLVGSEYTGADGIQVSYIDEVSSAGYISGQTQRYNSENRYINADAWVSNGITTTRIGLNDAVHTQTTSGGNYRYSASISINDMGMVAGRTFRWAAGAGGQDSWVYNGVSTIKAGLSGAEFTNADGSQYNYIGDKQEITASGMTMGSTNRYNGGSVSQGNAAWYFDGVNTRRVGLTGAEHTRTDGTQSSYGSDLNNSGQAIGSSQRYSGTSFAGRSAWLFDGTSTTEIGLTGSGYTRDDGYEESNASSMNEQGDVVGTSKKYNGATDMGQEAWLFDGANYNQLGLLGNRFVSNDGYSFSSAEFVDGSDTLITGFTNRFNNSGDAGKSAWLYNVETDRIFDFTLDEGAGGVASSRIFDVNADGSILGAYKILGVGPERAFYFREDRGLFDLTDLLVQAGLDLSLLDIASLNLALGNDVGQIYGGANLISGGGTTSFIIDTGDFAGLTGVSAVPVPAAVWLFGSGLIGLIGLAKRKARA